MRILVVGAGLYGATCARLLKDAGHEVRLIERTNTFGGHCATARDAESGCTVHLAGPHIFHTDNEAVMAFVRHFSKFNPFVNRPKAMVGGKLYSFPINLFTLYQVFGVSTPADGRAAVQLDAAPWRERFQKPANMHEHCLTTIGPRLYGMFIEGYTIKQWGKHPRDLPASTVKRLPVRYTFDDNYYSHRFQGIPAWGYTEMVQAMLHDVPVDLDADFLADHAMWCRRFDRIIFTGPIDELLGCKFGALAYRSMRFEHQHVGLSDYQGNAVINWCDRHVPYTRTVEYKHFDPDAPERSNTLVVLEYPRDYKPGEGDPHYPIRTAENLALYERYKAELPQCFPNVIVGGRMGEYRYVDMDQTVANAFTTVGLLCANRL